MTMHDELLRMAGTQTWQLALLVLVVWIIVRGFARNRPYLAHLLWLIVLIKCVSPPVWSTPAGLFCWLQSGNAARAVPPAPSETWTAGPSITMVPAASRVAETGDPAEVGLGKRARLVAPKISAPVDLATISASRPQRVLVVVWLTGSLAIVGFSFLRLLICVRRLRRTALRPDPALDAVVAGLSRRLRLRWRVRLLVTSSRVGPAVVGLLRPTIVLPEVVVAGRVARDLKPILAHELIHIRRADLWVALLQMVAQALWWFHPLVWLTGRFIARESERCCDEAVLAELGCPPARYAHSLMSILEWKRTLVAMPAFPGVRPVEITSQRLERIMRMGQGCRRRTPWWCWVVAVPFAALVLPGGARIMAGDPAPAADSATGKTTEGVPGWAAAAARPRNIVTFYDFGEAVPDKNSSAAAAVMRRGYDVEDLLKTIRAQTGLEGWGARQFLLERLHNRVVGEAVTAGETVADPPLFKDPNIVALPEDDAAPGEPAVMWVDAGGLMLVRRPAADQVRIERALAGMRAFGFRTVQIEARFVRGPADAMDKINSQWTSLPTAASAENAAAGSDSNLNGKDAERTSRASFAIEEELPVLVAILNDQQAKDVVDRMQADGRIEQLQSPKVSIHSGQTAAVADTRQSPFVVALGSADSPLRGARPRGEAIDPQIRVVEDGSRLLVRPVLHDRTVRLDYKLILSRIREVKERSVPGGNVQVPIVARTRVESSVELPEGKTLLLGGLKQVNEKGDVESLVVLLHAKMLPLATELLETANSRRAAAIKNWEAVDAAYKLGTVTLDLLLGSHWQLVDSDLAVVDAKSYAAGAAPDLEQQRRLAKEKLEVLERGHKSALATWRHIQALQVAGQKGGEATNEAQARAQYFLFRDRFEAALKAFQQQYPQLKRDERPDENRPAAWRKPADAETGAAEGEPEMYTVVYEVAELVMPNSKDGEATEPESKARQMADFESLVELLTSTVTPVENWKEFGGSAVAVAHPANLSLAVNQTEDGHQQVARLLEQMRQSIAQPERAPDIKIEFEGNTIVSDERLAALIRYHQLLAKHAQANTANEPKHWRSDVDVVAVLSRYYRDEGYFRARVGCDVILDDHKQASCIRYTIHEGNRYTVRQVSIVGISDRQASEWLRLLPLHSGNYFDGKSLRTAHATLRRVCRDEPGSRNQVVCDLRFQDVPGELNVVFKIAQRPATGESPPSY